MPRPQNTPNVLDRLKAKKPARLTVPICLDPTLLAESLGLRRDADSLARQLEAVDPDKVSAGVYESLETRAAAAGTAAATADETVEAETIRFVFEAVGSRAFDALAVIHPPTAAQRKEYKEAAAGAGLPKAQQIGPGFNSDTYPVAIISACLVEPITMSEAEVKDVFWDSGNYGQAEITELFQGAVGVNQMSGRRKS